MVLWLLLSGHYNWLLISMGLVSVLVTLLLAHKMKLIDGQSHPIHLFSKIIRLWVVLSGKIIVSNIDVTLRVLGIRPISPCLVKLKLDQNSDLGKVIYANAITLTPGSASLHIEDGFLYVHTISEEGAQSLLRGEMAKIIPQQAAKEELT